MIENNENNNKNFFINLLKELKSFLLLLIIVLIILFIINTFIGRAVKVKGSSMEPTLHDGNLLIIDKISYRFSSPKRFDIIVFPIDNKYLIKRIIALPGEDVQIINGKFYINDKELDENFGKETIDPNLYGLAKDKIHLSKDEYFCIGDNRNHSGDSRFKSIGNVHKDKIMGRAIFRILPFSQFGKL